MNEPDEKEQLVIKEIRKEQLKKFTNECHLFGDKIGALLGSSKVNIEIEEWTNAELPDFYYIHVDFDVPGYLRLLSFTWDPRRKELGRTVITIEDSVRGKGYGKKINSLSEDFAKDLGGKKFKISVIVNQEWRDSLINNQGYTQDQTEEDSVYKDFE